jgi:hypothetical protein
MPRPTFAVPPTDLWRDRSVVPECLYRLHDCLRIATPPASPVKGSSRMLVLDIWIRNALCPSQVILSSLPKEASWVAARLVPATTSCPWKSK